VCVNKLSASDVIAAICALLILIGICLFGYMEWRFKRDLKHECSMNPAISQRGTDRECAEYLKRSGALE
jgi:hypothetical protein